MNWVITVPPVGTPITYDQVYAHSRLPDTSDQDYVLMTIDDVVDFVQSEIAGSLFPQTLTATFYELERRRLPLPFGPVQSIISVTDANNIVLPSSMYALECEGNTDLIHLIHSSPQTPFTVVYIAGYPLDSNGVCQIPNDLRRAMLNQFSDFYENREGQSQRNLYPVANGLQRIYDKYRRTAMVQ